MAVVATDAAQVEQRGGRADVGARKRQRLVETAHRVSDLESDIPERIEEGLSQSHQMRILRIVTQEDHVDVALQAQRAASVAAHGHQREPSLGAVSLRARSGVGSAKQRVQQAIEDLRTTLRDDESAIAARDRSFKLIDIDSEVVPAARSELRGDCAEVVGGLKSGCAHSFQYGWSECFGQLTGAQFSARYFAIPSGHPQALARPGMRVSSGPALRQAG